MPNRLADSTSPYLRQHAENPVDWYEWNDEAFAKAKSENRPILLSVGYSSCHWCHVMAHESFENEEVAKLLNQHFVSIKVDREEMPHVDETYMTAVQLSSGQGGWPMTVFMTPDKKPFFAGTYFPLQDQPQRMGFLSLSQRIVSLWNEQRAELQKSAEEFSVALRDAIGAVVPESEKELSLSFVCQQVEKILADYDAEFGGFGGAPKFPPHTALALLLEVGGWDTVDEDLRRRCLHVAGHTLESICLSGLYDHVGGGFHRYCTDKWWHLPHFEKMLYDNALMLGNLTRASELIPSLAPFFSRVIGRTVAWMHREMMTIDGLLGSALDADSEGEEGKFYVWSCNELRNILGPDYEQFADTFSIEEHGNFHDEATHQLTGDNILHPQAIYDESIDVLLDKLLLARSARERPLFDNKAVVAWNALAVDALAEIDPEFAHQLCNKLLSYSDALPRTITTGQAFGAAGLEDVGALWLASQTVEHSWKPALNKFQRDPHSPFQSVSQENEHLFGASLPVLDSPIPSANSLVLRALIRDGEGERAWQILEKFSGWMERAPHATEGIILATVKALQANIQPLTNWNSETRKLSFNRMGWKIQSLVAFTTKGDESLLVEEMDSPFEIVLPAEVEEIRYTLCDDTQCLPIRSMKV